MKTAIAATIAILMLVACAQEQPEGATETRNPVNEPLVGSRPTIADAETGATVAVVLEDNTIGLPAEGIGAGPAVLTVENAGTQMHSLTVAQAGLEGGEEGFSALLGENLESGERATMEVSFTPGTWVAWCPLHEDQPGERVEFTVEQPEG